MRKLLVVVLLLSATLLAACGGSGGNASKTTTTTDPASRYISTSTTIPYKWPPQLNAVTSDVDKATAASVQQTDYPEGWNSDTLNPTTTPADTTIDENFVQCLYGPNPSPISAYAVSPIMASGDGNTISQSFVRIVPSSTAARNDFANFKASRLASCESAMYEKQFSFPPGTKLMGKIFGYDPPENIPTDTLLPPDNSTDVVGFRMLVAPRDAPRIYEDVYAYGVGRVETVLIFKSGTSTPDSSLEAPIIKVIKQRAQAASAKA